MLSKVLTHFEADQFRKGSKMKKLSGILEGIVINLGFILFGYAMLELFCFFFISTCVYSPEL